MTVFQDPLVVGVAGFGEEVLAVDEGSTPGTSLPGSGLGTPQRPVVGAHVRWTSVLVTERKA